MHFPPSVCIRLPYVRLSCNAVFMSAPFDLQSGGSGNPNTYRPQVSSLQLGLRHGLVVKCQKILPVINVSLDEGHLMVRYCVFPAAKNNRNSSRNKQLDDNYICRATGFKCYCSNLKAWRQNISCAIC